MGQGVEAGIDRQVLRHADGHFGIDERGVGDQRLAGDGDFHSPRGVRDDDELGHLGPGAGRGRHAQQRRPGPWHVVHALELEDVAPVGRNDADGLGAVHGRAAAHGDDGVAGAGVERHRPGHDLMVPGIGGQGIEQLVVDAGRFQALRDFVRQAHCAKARIGHEQGAPHAEPRGLAAGKVPCPPAEHEFRRDEFAQGQQKFFRHASSRRTTRPHTVYEVADSRGLFPAFK